MISKNDSLDQRFINLDQSDLDSIREINNILNLSTLEEQAMRFNNLKSDQQRKRNLFNLAKQIDDNYLSRSKLAKEYLSLSSNKQKQFWIDYLKDDVTLEERIHTFALFNDFIHLIKNSEERIGTTSQFMKLMQFQAGRRLIDRIVQYAAKRGASIEIIPERIPNEGYGSLMDESGNIKLIVPLQPSSYISSEFHLYMYYAKNDNGETIVAYKPKFLSLFHELTHVKRDLKNTSRGEIENDEIDSLLWDDLEEFWAIAGSKYSSEKILCQEVELPQRIGHIAFSITISENEALNMLNFWHHYNPLKIMIELAGGTKPFHGKILNLEKDSDTIDYCVNSNLKRIQAEIQNVDEPKYFAPKNKK